MATAEQYSLRRAGQDARDRAIHYLLNMAPAACAGMSSSGVPASFLLAMALVASRFGSEPISSPFLPGWRQGELRPLPLFIDQATPLKKRIAFFTAYAQHLADIFPVGVKSKNDAPALFADAFCGQGSARAEQITRIVDSLSLRTWDAYPANPDQGLRQWRRAVAA